MTFENDWIECDECGGTGKVPADSPAGATMTCHKCRGQQGWEEGDEPGE